MSPTTNAVSSNQGAISTLALVFGEDRNRGALRDALDSQGFASAAFDSVQTLWDSLSSGRRYDALIACADKGWSTRRWMNLRSMVKLPILVVVSRDALELASSFDEESLHGERIEFATAPVDGAELAMRLRLLHSRRHGAVLPPVEEDLIWGSFHFKRQARVVLVDGVEVRLQPREFEVALILFQNLGKVIGRAEIEAQLFDRPASPGSRVLDVHVTRVRRKLSLGPEKGVRLLTIYGVGYRLVALTPSGGS